MQNIIFTVAEHTIRFIDSHPAQTEEERLLNKSVRNICVSALELNRKYLDVSNFLYGEWGLFETQNVELKQWKVADIYYTLEAMQILGFDVEYPMDCVKELSKAFKVSFKESIDIYRPSKQQKYDLVDSISKLSNYYYNKEIHKNYK